MIKVEALFVILMSLVALSYTTKCGINKNGLQPRIIGGKIIPEHAYPWMVYFEFHFRKSKYTAGCGGVLISNQWVLSAAHCLEVITSRNFAYGSAYLGTNDISEDLHSNTSLEISIGPSNVSTFYMIIHLLI